MYHFTEHLLVEVISSLMSFPCAYASVCAVCLCGTLSLTNQFMHLLIRVNSIVGGAADR